MPQPTTLEMEADLREAVKCLCEEQSQIGDPKIKEMNMKVTDALLTVLANKRTDLYRIAIILFVRYAQARKQSLN